jgi:S-formylglutathione hydrolase FrmB
MSPSPPASRRLSRRGFLIAGTAATAGAGAAALELITHGVLPGKNFLDRLDGACSVAGAQETFRTPGTTLSGGFFSHARNRYVRYTLAYPPGHGPGARLPLVLYLYGDGGDHTSHLGGMPLAKALAAHTRGGNLPPLALVAADAGSLYFNPHPGDDPQAMLTQELIPRLRQRGLGTGHGSIGVIGVSMGGYGALLLTEKHPDLIAAAAAISPAIWTSYDQARAVNPQAFASAADFTADDVITHAARLGGIPVRIASGADDPFHSGVLALARKLPASAAVEITAGCHDVSFFKQQQLPSLQFLGRHLAA